LIRVLIIDDDVDMTDVLKMVLEADDFDVKTLNTAAEGISAAREWGPDVIILDQMMPVMEGSEVCQVIRKFSQVPILMLSVVNKPEIIAQTLDAGADDYLVKPVPNSVLVAHLHKLARRMRAEQTARVAANHPL
jgi:DNA-binding response OmpR family regulator